MAGGAGGALVIKMRLITIQIIQEKQEMGLMLEEGEAILPEEIAGAEMLHLETQDLLLRLNIVVDLEIWAEGMEEMPL